jgi:hypothetical protein
MRFLKYGAAALLFLLVAASGFAQSEPSADDQAAPADAQPGARAQHRRSYGTPCWKQAGMTPQMVNQKWQIEEQQKQNIAAVCSEQSTGPQQKHDKIEQIHAKTAQDIAKLIPAEELAKFNKCEAELEKSHPSASKKEIGPCGGMIPTTGSQGMEHPH